MHAEWRPPEKAREVTIPLGRSISEGLEQLAQERGYLDRAE